MLSPSSVHPIWRTAILYLKIELIIRLTYSTYIIQYTQYILKFKFEIEDSHNRITTLDCQQ